MEMDFDTLVNKACRFRSIDRFFTSPDQRAIYIRVIDAEMIPMIPKIERLEAACQCSLKKAEHHSSMVQRKFAVDGNLLNGRNFKVDLYRESCLEHARLAHDAALFKYETVCTVMRIFKNFVFISSLAKEISGHLRLPRQEEALVLKMESLQQQNREMATTEFAQQKSRYDLTHAMLHRHRIHHYSITVEHIKDKPPIGFVKSIPQLVKTRVLAAIV